MIFPYVSFLREDVTLALAFPPVHQCYLMFSSIHEGVLGTNLSLMVSPTANVGSSGHRSNGRGSYTCPSPLPTTPAHQAGLPAISHNMPWFRLSQLAVSHSHRSSYSGFIWANLWRWECSRVMWNWLINIKLSSTHLFEENLNLIRALFQGDSFLSYVHLKEELLHLIMMS